MYVMLLSTPMIILTMISIFYNNSLLGLEISMTMDEVNVLIVSSYICWMEESRHTPIRGMYLIRDVLFAFIFIGLYIDSFMSGTISILQSIIILIIGLLYYIILTYFDGIEQFILKTFNLRQSKNFNAKFLLTSNHQVADFLQIKDIISQNKEKIQDELNDYRDILVSLEENYEDQEVLMNFAKLFLPIKKACEFKQEADDKAVLQQIEQTWSQGSQRSNDQQRGHYNTDDYNYATGPTWNDGTSAMGTFKNTTTYTDDFINEQDQKDYQLNMYEKILRYAFYPVYMATFAQGRVFYLVGYVAMFTLVGLMFGLANATVFFAQGINGYSFLSIVTSLLLCYPTAKYFLNVSSHNDYDFTNIFLQSMILKLILTAVAFIIYTSLISPEFAIDKGTFTNLIVRIVLLAIYLIFMAVNRFATRYTNFKYFVGLSVVLWVAEVVAEEVVNAQV